MSSDEMDPSADSTLAGGPTGTIEGETYEFIVYGNRL
jgi:hypothetical protein